MQILVWFKGDKSGRENAMRARLVEYSGGWMKLVPEGHPHGPIDYPIETIEHFQPAL